MASRKRQRSKRKTKTLSVMVIRRIKDMMSLVSSVEAYRGKLAAALGKRYAPRLLEGEALPDLILLLDLAVRDAQAALDRLIRLDNDADRVDTHLGLLRKDRDRLVREELHPRAVAVRGAIDLAFGRKLGALVHGMSGRTRRRPASLARQVRIAIHLLSDPSLEPPPPKKNPHASVDRAGWSRQLEPLYRQLVELEKEIGSHGAEHTALVVDRRNAMGDFDAAYGDALSLIATAFAIARFDLRAIRNLKSYDRRRRLSREAAKKRQARATEAASATEVERAGEPEQEEQEAPPARGARAKIPKRVAKWLEKRRLFGS